jgi:Uma2 family endonuclease
MFLYYSLEQARRIASEPGEATRQFRGPDVFFVAGVDGRKDRDAWVVWEEGGRYPNVIIELLSPSTAEIDRTVKKRLYQDTFRTPEYFLYDRPARCLEGFRLAGSAYQPIAPDARGWLWSEELGRFLGAWQGERGRVAATWLRLYGAEGRLVPTAWEPGR